MKQSMCPLTDEWIKKPQYMYDGMLVGHENEWNLAICDKINGLGGFYSNKITQTEKDKPICIYLHMKS